MKRNFLKENQRLGGGEGSVLGLARESRSEVPRIVS